MATEWRNLFSSAVMVPVQADRPYGQSGRIMIDWRGIPLASPFSFNRVPPTTRMKIAKHWEESGGLFVKLVDPRFGTTVDYAVRSLFNPIANGQRTNRVYVFLEMAPNCPGGGDVIPVWTVVERIDRDTIETLTDDAVAEQQAIIEEIIERRSTAPRQAIEAAFGEMSPWTNPDWGDEGNLHLVCTNCVVAVSSRGGFCPNCGRPTKFADLA